MNQDLQRLIDIARKYNQSEAEQEEQVRSFAFGNTNIEDESITKSDIDQAMETLRTRGDSDT